MLPGSDNNIQPRQIFVELDDVVNSMAKDNYFENWKLYGAAVDEQFIVTWDGESAIDVQDVDNQPSYITLPANYAALPKHDGIQEVWPLNYEFGAVRKRDHADIRLTRRLMSGNMQDELGGYPRGNLFVFDQVGVGKNFATKFGVRLVTHDASQITADAPYPVPSNLEEELIDRVVKKFLDRRTIPTDVVRDKQDAINRQ